MDAPMAGTAARKREAEETALIVNRSVTRQDDKKVNFVEHNRPIKDKIAPHSLKEAKAILTQRRVDIKANGYQPKYADKELTELVKTGNIGEERFQVRFMEKSYLQDRNMPDEPLSGKLGVVMQGTSGIGAKYWSTSFDQLEDTDTDPKLMSEKLGIEYNPETEYVLLIIDSEKSVPLTGVKSVPATFENLSAFSNTELPNDFPPAFTEKAMTPGFQAKYAKHYNAAVNSGNLPNKWSRDAGGFQEYLDTTDLDEDQKNNLIKRMKMHDKIGNNQDNLGNGLTKDMISDSPNEFGVVETLNFERKEINLSTLHGNDALLIIGDLKPI